MNDESQNTMGSPTPEELREQVERTRDELGQTVEALAGKADVKAQAKEKAAAVKEQAASASAQIREKTAEATRLVKDKAPEPLWEKAEQGAKAARDNRTPLLAGGALLIAFLLIRRGRKRNR
ncbi:hypothetical protein B1H20_33135 [Streptomyces violaceoruber]|uniref:DUF3618 domain-containing protein n=1 Tax=Streptomyces violaceoruber TaxID=1935 RepID=A0A1V0UKN6_STRVN|nr:DUF3618 domain-containing protein [Streptomyces violaceoruber]ARF65731.1 hypothetical protein B1H20_33135 [Streptomyces violaceoruber]